MTALSNAGLRNFRAGFLFNFKIFCTPVTATAQQQGVTTDLIGSPVFPEFLIGEG